MRNLRRPHRPQRTAQSRAARRLHGNTISYVSVGAHFSVFGKGKTPPRLGGSRTLGIGCGDVAGITLPSALSVGVGASHCTSAGRFAQHTRRSSSRCFSE